MWELPASDSEGGDGEGHAESREAAPDDRRRRGRPPALLGSRAARQARAEVLSSLDADMPGTEVARADVNMTMQRLARVAPPPDVAGDMLAARMASLQASEHDLVRRIAAACGPTSSPASDDSQALLQDCLGSKPRLLAGVRARGAHMNRDLQDLAIRDD